MSTGTRRMFIMMLPHNRRVRTLYLEALRQTDRLLREMVPIQTLEQSDHHGELYAKHALRARTIESLWDDPSKRRLRWIYRNALRHGNMQAIQHFEDRFSNRS